MKINENPWKTMKINGNQLKTMKINENQWKTMKINENQWKSKKKQWNYSKSLHAMEIQDPKPPSADENLISTEITPNHLKSFDNRGWRCCLRTASDSPPKVCAPQNFNFRSRAPRALLNLNFLSRAPRATLNLNFLSRAPRAPLNLNFLLRAPRAPPTKSKFSLARSARTTH